MLLEGLPRQTTTFDVITHSRGGLVLRTLVERADAFGPLADRFKLGHAVLVASPNEGTPLATPERWSDTVGWVANLLELFPDNPFTHRRGVRRQRARLARAARVWRHSRPARDGRRGRSDRRAADRRRARRRTPTRRWSPTTTRRGQVLLRLLDTGVDQFFGSANDLVVPSEGGWRIDQPGAAHHCRRAHRLLRTRRQPRRRCGHARQLLLPPGDRGLPRARPVG